MKGIDKYIKESRQVNEGLESVAKKFQNIFSPVQGYAGYAVLIGDPFTPEDEKTYNAVVGFCDAIFGKVDMGGRMVSLPALMEMYEEEYNEEVQSDDEFGYIYFPSNKQNFPVLCNMRDYTIQI